MTDRRPYIPLPVRVSVAEIQFVKQFPRPQFDVLRDRYFIEIVPKQHLGNCLKFLLEALFAGGPCQLDHDPALELRKKRRVKGKIVYSPPANSPDHLVYRRKANHLQKTTGRKKGAEKTVTTKGSDIWLIAKARRQKKRPENYKQRIKSRGFDKRAKNKPIGPGPKLKSLRKLRRKR